ncbi:MAG: DUF1365 domain-containing protein [Porticoccaceae bacterium]|nr:DUF1365 domain-containing protein [Porticoccaceae bacterium]
MKTCLYTGRVNHTRLHPRVHRFHYWICQLLVDLEQLEQGSAAVFPARGWSWLLKLRHRDHLRATGDDTGQSLRTRLNNLVSRSAGFFPEGKVMLLTGFGLLWHRFNPVSFYYCFDAQEQLQCIVAEVTNTPWKEQSYYVLDARWQRGEDSLVFRCDKDFHVSPFMPMDTSYHWYLNVPAERLHLNIGVQRQDQPLFNATMKLERQPLTSAALMVCLLRQPLMSLQVVAAIHWQALRLWLKSTPFFTHPRSAGEKP